MSSSSLPAAVAADLERCRGRRETARSIPPAAYASPDVLKAEEARLFRTGWVGLGRGDRWSATGDYSAVDLGGVPILVARGEDGQLRAFSNTCRHRGSQLLVDEGSCARIRCPFHAWTYALDGHLMSAPRMNQSDNFERSDHGLHEFSLVEHAGFVFASLEAGPPDFAEWIGEYDTLHTSWPVADLITLRRREFTVDCNWKAFAEVFNEYYHLPYVHTKSINGLYGEPDDVAHVAGAFASQFGPTTGTGALLEEDQDKALPPMPGLTGRDADGARYTWFFPNLVTAIGRDALWLYEIYPDGPNRTRCAQAVCFPQRTIDSDGFAERAAIYLDRMDVAIEEDIPVLEQQHVGLQSPYAQQGPFSYLEPAVALFANWYAERMLRGSSTTPVGTTDTLGG